MRANPRLCCLLLTSVTLSGCLLAPKPAAPPPEAALPAEPAPSPLAKIEKLVAEGQYEEALIECADLSRRAPDTPGLEALRVKALQGHLAAREVKAETRAPVSEAQMTVEAKEKGLLPDTYGRVRAVRGETAPLRSPDTPMHKALAKPVTLHLKGADLGAFIEALGRDQNLNIIADAGLAAGKRVDIEMDNVPLLEVLDYLTRNLGVTFYVGENTIWVTSPANSKGVPMETRIYRLRSGLQFHASDWSATARPGEKAVTGLPALTDAATELAAKTNYLVDVLQRFVPAVPGSEFHLDANTHTLLVRTTRENLRLVEELLAALDISPPQVLIEARFIETSVADLRELGINWLLNSELGFNNRVIIRGGREVNTPASKVTKGSRITYEPYGYDAQGPGPFPLGPQGAFTENRAEAVNPPTADQGLNLTFKGLLTEPMFEAVLHALEITGKGRTLSAPRVTTVNNTPAKLRSGEDLLYFDEFQAQMFNAYDPATRLTYQVAALFPRGKPVREELGYTLVAVPSVGADLRTISLMLMPTISQFDGWTSYLAPTSQTPGGTNTSAATTGGINVYQVEPKLPKIRRSEVQTKVIVQSGETVVMGGLINSVKQRTLHKVPLLSDIPLLGLLFRRYDMTEENRHLLVFVTATVISERGETLVPVAAAQ